MCNEGFYFLDIIVATIIFYKNKHYWKLEPYENDLIHYQCTPPKRKRNWTLLIEIVWISTQKFVSNSSQVRLSNINFLSKLFRNPGLKVIDHLNCIVGAFNLLDFGQPHHTTNWRILESQSWGTNLHCSEILITKLGKVYYAL